MPESLTAPKSDASFSGGGETGALVRSIEWKTTLLGPSSKWPQSLRTALSICLNSRFPIALYWGPQFVMLYNDSLLPMVGANKHPHAMGRPALEVLAEIRHIIEPLLRHVTTTGEATWSEDLMLPLVRHENVAEESYFTFTYSPIRDESGDVGGVFCAVMETTDKVIEERRLRLLNALAKVAQSETKQEACVHAAAQIAPFQNDVPFALIYLLDENSRIAMLAGASNVDPGSSVCPKLIPFGTPSIWPYEDAFTNEGSQYVEIGAEISGSQRAVILPIERSGGGRPMGFVVLGLSPLLRRSDSYGRFHNLLAASLSQAVSNAAAYEEERKRSQALAELDRAKTTFFSNVSHEFRTPLTLMLAPIQDMLSMPDGSPVDQASVELLHRNALRLLKLVNTLLEFSRIEARRVEAVYEPVNLSAVTADLASSFRAAIERAGLQFHVDCMTGSEELYVDRDMWEKIVLNLLSNAFKFTFEGSITLRLYVAAANAVLEVSDTGIGIADHDIPRLFERFHRVEGARSRSHEGSGIGLALIQELVRIHGGEIEVASAQGAGTTFRVRIPRGLTHLPPERVQSARALSRTTVGVNAFVEEVVRWGATPPEARPVSSQLPASGETRERIVFADDNADMRSYVTRLLSERWDVEPVSDGLAALECIRRDPPALVLCDVMMPGMDGFALVQAIRDDAVLRGIPIIILSARAGEEEAAKGLSTGANDYIVKPFSARDLLVRVTSALATARASKEIAAIAEKQRANFYRHFMQAPFPIAVFQGPNHIIELANPRILEAWGKGIEVLGMTLIDAVPELKDQPFIDYLDEVLRTSIAYEGHGELRPLPCGPSGELQRSYYNFVYAPLRDLKGTIEGVLVSAFDVTAQVRDRQEIERTVTLLQTATVERARALDEANRANQAKDEFLATVSHELRTPLNAIIGWSVLVRKDAFPTKDIPQALETIERNARIQARLIEDVLDLSRIEQGKLTLSVSPLDVEQVVDAALEAVRPAAEAKGITLQRVLDARARIVGDADRLQQVLWNLLSNAIKFTPKGGCVRVRVQQQRSNIELVVVDDGQGIESEFLPYVFDRFRQADAKMSRHTGGLGLGLAIVRSIVELHGGTVTAESDGVGKGATFKVRLPIAVQVDNVSSSSVNERGQPTPLPFQFPPVLKNLRILVVDDEVETRELMRHFLEECKSTITLASNAKEALELLRHGEFDLLISDIGMPEVDGYAFIREVRTLSRETAARVPAIALTAYAQSSDRALALSSGFDICLTKPIDLTQFLAVMATLIHGARDS